MEDSGEELETEEAAPTEDEDPEPVTEPDPCEENGHNYVDGECTVCGDKENKDEDPCKDGHNYVDGECTVCGDKENKDEDPCKDGHNYVDGECTVCGDKENKDEDPCKDGHNYVDGECTVCGYKPSEQNPGSTTNTGTPTPAPSEKPDVSNEDLADTIKDLPDDVGEIEVTYGTTDTESILSAGVFSALSTFKKDIRLINGQVEWYFNGAKINTTNKSIKLDVSVAPSGSTKSPNKTQIIRLVKNTPTVVLTFAPNGTLPGPATITVSKADLFPHSTKSIFYVYHIEGNSYQFITSVNVVNDHLSFDIFHNSDYIITESPIRSVPANKDGGYKGPIDEHKLSGGVSGSTSGGTSSSVKENPHTGA